MFDIASQYDLIEHSPVRPKLHKPEMPRVEKPTLTAEQIRADISTTSDIYVHLDDKVMAEGTEVLAREILGNCDQAVTQESKLVS